MGYQSILIFPFILIATFKLKYSLLCLDMTGYITNVTEIVTSRKSGNDYFDVYLKTSPTVQEVIRVMIKHNRSIKRSFFSEAKEIPVKITNLTKRDNVSFFNSNFNSSSLVKTHLTTSFDFAADNLFSSIDHVNTFEKGTFNIKGAFIWSSAETKAKKKDGSMERVRDGVIVQREDSTISVSVWGKLIDSMSKERVCYEFIPLRLKQLYGHPKLATEPTSSIKLSKDVIEVNWDKVETLDWKKVEQDFHDNHFPTIPGSIIGCSVDLFPKCVFCKKKINIPQNEKMFSCPLCNERLITKKLHFGFAGRMEVENGEDTLSLTFFKEVMHPFLGKNFELQDKQTIEDKILELSDCVKITYSKSKLVVTNILEVEEEDDLI